MAITTKKLINVHSDGTQKVTIIKGDIETGVPLPKQHREKKYDFDLSELAETQSRFFAPDEATELKTFKLAARNHVDKERQDRAFKQNFLIRDEVKNGVNGIRIFCVNIADYPMRKPNKEAEPKAA